LTTIQVNKVYNHLTNSNRKITLEVGGTRSGKTYNILLWIILHYCQHNENKIITICRKTFPALRGTVMRDFLEILKSMDLYDEQHHNKSNHEYKLDSNLIEFISLDQPQKVRGRKRDLLFCNEMNELDREAFQQLAFRTTGKIIGDLNPSDEYHWIWERLEPRDDVEIYSTTYLDNPFIDDSIRSEIELLKDTDENYWRIYGLGQRAISKATIFKYTEIDSIPDDAQLVAYGMDFGFNDPTTLVATYKKDHNIYFKEMLYRSKMTTEDIHQYLKGVEVLGMTYADSARPEIIEQLRRYGHKIMKSYKGANSVLAGIDLLKRYKLHVTKDSDNMIKEFRNYKWKEDRAGRMTNIPQDDFNHTIDAARYSCYSILSRPNFGKYYIH
jgi:phage terminase large subunit